MIETEKWTAQAAESGLLEKEGSFTCIYCGKVFENGEVFPVGDRFFTAQRAAQMHAAAHTDAMEQLFAAGEKALSLTENQKNLLRLFAAGKRDGEIAAELGVAASTVRHQRFMFREKAKSARLFLALWAQAEAGKDKQKETAEELLPPHEGAKMVDERYVITEEENQKILENVFLSLEPLRLKVFSKKEKKKIVILRQVAAQFEPDRQYTEPEVNAVLKEIWADFATMRRYLIEYGYLDRTKDGKTYWKRG